MQRRRAPDADGDGEDEALLQLAEMGGGEDSDAAGLWVRALASLLDPPSRIQILCGTLKALQREVKGVRAVRSGMDGWDRMIQW